MPKTYTGIISVKCDEPFMTHTFHRFSLSAENHEEAQKKAMEILINRPGILKHAFEFYRVPRELYWDDWRGPWRDSCNLEGDLSQFLSRETKNYRSYTFNWRVSLLLMFNMEADDGKKSNGCPQGI